MPTSATPRKTAPKKATKSTQRAGTGRRAPGTPGSYAATSWGNGVNQFELTTPSGQTCLARDIPLEELMAVGLLDAINGLQGIVETEVLPKAKGQPPMPQVNMDRVMKEPQTLLQVLDLVNSVVCLGVVEPQVLPIKDEKGQPVERENGKIYVDSIPTTDRFFLFNELTGGLEQLAAFRS